MEIQGKLIQKLSPVSGISGDKGWTKQEFIIETEGKYPKKVCIAAWGNSIKELDSVSVNSNLTVSIDVESREFNNRWYTDVKAWKIVGQSKPKDEPNAEIDSLPF